MGHALRCFREGRTILESCMEVFIREPSINWLVSMRNRVLKDDGVTEKGIQHCICIYLVLLTICIYYKMNAGNLRIGLRWLVVN